MMQAQQQQPMQPQQPAAGGQPLREGMTGVDNATGRRVIVRGGQVQWADQPPPPAFNTIRGAPAGVMSNQFNREDEILQGASDERSRLSNAAMQANRFGTLMDAGQGTGGILRFDLARNIATGIFGDKELSEMEQINNALAPLQRQAGSGAMSDKDLAVFQRSVVSPELAPEANRNYIAMVQASNSRASDYEMFLQEYRALYGPGSLADGQRLWRQYSSDQPLFNDDGTVRQGVVPWREWFASGGQSQQQAQQLPSLALSERPTSRVRVSDITSTNNAGQRFSVTPEARNAYSRIPGGLDVRAQPGSERRPVYLGDIPESSLQVGQYGITPDGRYVQGTAPRQVAVGGRQHQSGQQPRQGGARIISVE